MAPRTRKPTGAVPWPLILVEGEEKAGKSWAIAELSASERVGATYWIDLGEGSGDEYGAIPGARYEIVDHDGTWRDIIAQVREVRAVAQAAHDAGDPPVVLAIDSMTAEWVMLADWADQRARKSERGRKLLKDDPDAEVPISPNYWNDSNGRHRKLMTLLMTFPGIVVVTARGKWVAEMDKKGNPVPNSKVYKVEGQKTLAFDATVWVRLTREDTPLIVGARSVHAGVKPGTDKPRKAPSFTLDWLVFDVLKCDPRAAHVRDVRALDATGPDDDEQAAAAEQPAAEQAPPAVPGWEDKIAKAETAGDLAALKALWDDAKATEPQNTALAQRIKAAVATVKANAEPMSTPAQRGAIATACTEHGANSRREHRLALVSLLVGKTVHSTNDLTISEAGHVLDSIDKLAKDGGIGDTINAAISAWEPADVAG